MNSSVAISSLRQLFVLITALALLIPLLGFLGTENARADEPFVVVPAALASDSEVDGQTEATAAASCWEIKQIDPDAEDGIYWLWTQQLGAPDQFYCDQTTDGGGWVMIGRGREEWSESNLGSGSSAQVRSPHTGTAAFRPRQLPSQTIEGLLGGESVASLPDGIRLHRAQNEEGTQWQDVTFSLSSPREGWTWQFYNNQRIGQWTIGGASGSGGTTTDFGTGTTYNRVSTQTGSNQGWMSGFGYGSSARGNPSASSFIWGDTTSMRNPRPFTQVFLRPELTSEQVALELPSTGTQPITGEPGAQAFAEATSWGVAGIGAGPSSIEGSVEVSAFAESEGMVFVGGNFTRAQTSSTGANQQDQAYLAAFDRDTGDLITAFRPTFNNQIKAIAAMPGGRIAVGGYFTTVNGQPRQGLVVLDVHTGEVDPDFDGRLINYLGGGTAPIVRTLDVQDGWLYVGGAFTHGTGGSESSEVYMRSAGRFSVTDGTPQAGWNPEFNGTVVDLDVSTDGSRVYYAGYFSQSQTSPTMRGAALLTSDASALPWDVHLSSSVRSGYQQAVQEVGDRVWLGGSEHSLFSYGRDGLGLLSTNIGQRGGDFQAIASDGANVFAGCHCFDVNLSGADSWPNPGDGWTSLDRINATGAWNASTGDFDPEFSPETYTRVGAGTWALFVDSTGTVWEGGDFTASLRSGYVRQWSGGFVRFAQRDTEAPAIPGGLENTSSAGYVHVSWDGVANASRYEVINSGRVVASTDQTAATVPLGADTEFAVRAVDESGNRSGSTAPMQVEPPVTGPQDPSLIALGSSWSYWFDSSAPADGWEDPGFDETGWQAGTAPLGWGQAVLGTTLSSGATQRPITSFYRRNIEVIDATTVESVLLTTRADDGIIVYINGVEVLRQNVEEGLSGPGVYAETAVSANAALVNPITVAVPGNLFATGENTVAVSVHSNYRSTPSHSFELSADAVFGTQPPTDPDPDPDPDPEPEPEPEPEPGEVIVAGSTWSYHFGAEGVSTDWAQPGADVSSWESGLAPQGWGHSELGTTLNTDISPRPVVSYHRTTFEVPENAVGGVEFTTRADDGVVVFINGVEVVRENVEPGLSGPGAYAIQAVSASAALNNPVVFTVPVADLEPGENTVAVSVHSNYRSTPSHSFELSANMDPSYQPPTDEQDPDPEPEPDPDPDPEPGEVIVAGSTWSYHFGAEAVSTDWAQPGADVSSWQSGLAPQGWGHSELGTTLNTDISPRPVVSYHRTTFEIPENAVGGVEFTTRADDGVVVFINGVELARENVEPGLSGPGAYAIQAVSASAALNNPVVFTVPVADLEPGENTVAVSVHSNYRSTPNHSFELSANMDPGFQPMDAGPAFVDGEQEAPLETPAAREEGASEEPALAPLVDDGTEGEGTVVQDPAADGSKGKPGSEETSAPDAQEPEPEAAPEPDPAPAPAPAPAPVPAPEPEPALESEPDAAENDADGLVVVGDDAEWGYYGVSEPVIDGWQLPETDVSSWQEGPAPLGWGSDDLGTIVDLDVPLGSEDRPITTYYRTGFEVPADATGDLEMTVGGDIGVIVYVNGEEVGRLNLPAKDADPDAPPTVGPETLGVLDPNIDSDNTEPQVFVIPVADLEGGENVIAVEVHSVDTSVVSQSFTLEAAIR